MSVVQDCFIGGLVQSSAPKYQNWINQFSCFVITKGLQKTSCTFKNVKLLTQDRPFKPTEQVRRPTAREAAKSPMMTLGELHRSLAQVEK